MSSMRSGYVREACLLWDKVRAGEKCWGWSCMTEKGQRGSSWTWGSICERVRQMEERPMLGKWREQRDTETGDLLWWPLNGAAKRGTLLHVGPCWDPKSSVFWWDFLTGEAWPSWHKSMGPPLVVYIIHPYSAMKKHLCPSWFFAYLSNLNDSGHQTNCNIT